MALFQKQNLSLFLVLSLSFLSLAFALDMSIIDYDAKLDATKNENHLMKLYETWLVKHGKVYNALGEKERRFEIFKDNLRYIENHNIVENQSFKLGLTKFADLTNEEYRSKFLGTRPRKSKGLLSASKSDRYAVHDNEELPESVDWRAKGAVNPVKDQGQCGEFFCFYYLLN